LRREFGLTAAEADVALEITKGDGRDATAARLGIGVATVRTHLVRIFEKTGVGRQAELVRLVLRGETDADGG
jgi:DNA-binding CsgD family transcriptional regulator